MDEIDKFNEMMYRVTSLNNSELPNIDDIDIIDNGIMVVNLPGYNKSSDGLSGSMIIYTTDKHTLMNEAVDEIYDVAENLLKEIDIKGFGWVEILNKSKGPIDQYSSADAHKQLSHSGAVLTPYGARQLGLVTIDHLGESGYKKDQNKA